MDTVILILRTVIGLLFIGHGTQKLLGWWGGGGIQGTTGMMNGLGYRPAVRSQSWAVWPKRAAVRSSCSVS